MTGESVLQALDADAVRRWCTAALAGLRAARQELDDLNVYPVPDGDTGTNLLLTMQAAADAVELSPRDLSATLAAMASGALLGARGNSGAILSQLLRGYADVLGSCPLPPGAADLQRALTHAADLAYAAVAAPVEGTVLSVARAAADAGSRTSGDLAAVVRQACAGATEALQRTPALLPQLRAAGVVDAGGRGLCVLLDALELVVTGRSAAPRPATVLPAEGSAGTAPRALVAAREGGSADFGYEVQYLLHGAGPAQVADLRARLGGLGDSLVVVEGEQEGRPLHHVHVHVNDVGAAVEAGVEAGRPSRITVTRFADGPGSAGGDGARGRRAVVAVARGAALQRLFRECGAAVLDPGPAEVTVEQVLQAARATGAADVVLLPNDPLLTAVADRAADQAAAEGLRVRVVATCSPVQGLAALAVTDLDRGLAQDVAAMADAAQATAWGEVTGGSGEVRGLLRGEVVLAGDDVEEVARRLVDRMLEPGGELVTVLVGEGAPAAEGLASYVVARHHDVQVDVRHGGQPHPAYVVGVE